MLQRKRIDGASIGHVITNELVAPSGKKIRLVEGSADDPSAFFKNSSSTGIFSPSTGVFGITSNGVTQLEISDTTIISNTNIIDPYNVMYYGATGDGITDDTTALQSAINFVKNNGGELIIPPGTYVISVGLNLGGNTSSYSIRGSGPDSIIKRGSNFISCFGGGPINGLVLEHFSIDGDETANANSNHGISIFDCNNVVMRHLNIYDVFGSGILVFITGGVGDYANVSVDHCFVDGRNVANNGILFVDMVDSLMSNCLVENVNPLGSPSYSLQLKNDCARCIIENCIAKGGVAGVAFGNDNPTISDGVIDSIVNNCILYGPAANGFVTATGINNTISHLVIDMLGVGNEPIRFLDSNATHPARNNTLTNIVIRNKNPTKDAVRFDSHKKKNMVQITSLDPADTSAIIRFNDATAINNVVTLWENGGDFTSDFSGFINDLGSNNKVIYRHNSSTPVQVIAGTAVDPSLCFQASTTTGLFLETSDTLGVAWGGSRVADFGNGRVQLDEPIQLPFLAIASDDAGITIPDGTSCVEITSGTSTGAFAVTGPSAASGQLLFVRNSSAHATTGSIVLNSGSGASFFFNGANWLKMV